MISKHLICRARRCTNARQESHLMCSQHWAKVPQEIQRKYHRFNNLGGLQDSKLGAITKMAIAWVAYEERYITKGARDRIIENCRPLVEAQNHGRIRPPKNGVGFLRSRASSKR